MDNGLSVKKRSIGFLLTDIILLVGAILPPVVGMILKILTTPPADGIEIAGARIYFTLPTPIQALPITESQVNSWLVMITIFFFCLYMTHGLAVRAKTRRQLLAEWVVEKTEKLVIDNMGDYFRGFAPFVGAIMALSAFSSLVTLVGLYPPTSDINIVGGWAILVFILITYYKFKCGPLHYLKSFGEPVPLLTPLNLISEVATPVSMAFRHYGNVLSGSVISVLVATGLQGISSMLLHWLPGILGKIPFLQIGIPAILSVYFDLFSGCLQAFIFAMLTMLYVSGGFPEEDYAAKKAQRQQKELQKKQQSNGGI